MKRLRTLILCLCVLVLTGCQTMRTTSPLHGFSPACVVLSTPSPDRMAAWYKRVLDFHDQGTTTGVPGVGLRQLVHGDAVIVLATVPGQQPPCEPKDPPRHLEISGLRNLVFWVHDLEKANAHLETLGVPLLLRSVPVPSIGVITTSFRDPDGNLVALWSRP
ncbi:hypothetical protein MASR1M90_08540 [Desulfovibrionales bacterium]